MKQQYRAQKQEIVDNYLKRHPDMQRATLAKKIAEDKGDLWSSSKNPVDAIRSMIRYREGATGTRLRETRGLKKKGYQEALKDAEVYWEAKKREELDRINERGGAKIFIFDIETLPLTGFIWRLWKQNLSLDHLMQDEWAMVTWAGKWLFEDDVLGDCLTEEEARNKDDKRIIQSLGAIVDEADVIVAHFGDKFDIPLINGRRLAHRLPPMSPFQSVDTWKISKRNFNFPSHKLDYLHKHILGGEGKIKVSLDLWKRCFEGDAEAIQEMLEYNIQDIRVLEDVYLALRPWDRTHPNMGLYIEDDVRACCKCGNTELEYLDKPYVTPTGLYDTYRCKSEICGALSRSRRRSNIDNRFLNINLAR